MHDHATDRAAGVLHLHFPSVPIQVALVADLPSTLGVKGGLIKHDFDLLAGSRNIYDLLILDYA